MGAPKIDFKNDEKWQAFREEWIKNGGVVSDACRKTGVSENTFRYWKQTRKEFLDWLEEGTQERLHSAASRAQLKIAEAVENDEALTSAQRADMKLLLELVNKLQRKIEINNTTNIQSATFSRDERRDLAEWAKDVFVGRSLN